jgi:hypothetical protein
MSRDVVPTATLENFIEEVRSFLRDYPEMNRLLGAEETSDRQLRWAIAETLDDFASTPPLLGFFTLERIPRSILLKGVLANVLRSASIFYLRNSLRYTDGAIQVDTDKHREMIQIAQIFQNEFDIRVTRFKVATNLDRALGSVRGIHSDYYLIAGYHLGS